jgi:hypothetical protein
MFWILIYMAGFALIGIVISLLYKRYLMREGGAGFASSGFFGVLGSIASGLFWLALLHLNSNYDNSIGYRIFYPPDVEGTGYSLYWTSLIMAGVGAVLTLTSFQVIRARLK